MKTVSVKCHRLFFFLVLAFSCLLFSGFSQNFPSLNVVIEDSSATQGYYFLTPYTNTLPNNYDHAQLILDNYGRIVFYRIIPKGLNLTPTIDFKLQPNGQVSYFDINKGKHFIMDSTFTVVDSIACVNGVVTDQHDLQIFHDNHYLLFGTETRFMNLTSYHYFGINHTSPGGANAQVFGVVIQEFNENKELIWEWKGHDHYQFGDVDPVWLFNPNKVDWTHANAVERDNDGNIMLSLRHFNEITKIDYASGNILWRMGGKQNQFAFPNDPVRFTGQHDIRRISDTSVSLFDNGQYTNPKIGRALEYALDESNKVATLVWSYVYDSAVYSVACGNHQYIENGNHLVDFGFTNIGGIPWMVVVKPDYSKVLEISFPAGYISYRAFNYINLPWKLKRPNVDCQMIGQNYYLVAEPGYSEYHWSTGDTTASIQIHDTGTYCVFVPYGSGYISSEHVRVPDITNPCLFLGSPALAKVHELSLRTLPNPATDRIRILFQLPSDSRVTISLQSVIGSGVGEVIQGQYATGHHEAVMDVSSLKPGIYILTLQASGTSVTRKIVIQ